MQKRRKKTLAVALAALCLLGCGIAALLLRSPGQAAAPAAHFSLGELTPAESAPFTAHFTWPLTEPLNHMRVLGPGELTEAALPAALYSPQISLRATHNQLQLTIEHPQERSDAPEHTRPTYQAELLRTFERRQPNGRRHTIRHILLSCHKPATAPGDSPTIFLQQLELDVTMGSIDLIPCTTPAPDKDLPARDYHSIAPTGLPEKINGAPLRRDMLRLLYAIAAIDTPQLAQYAARELSAFAWQLAAATPAAHEPWPRCWGDAADDAAEISRRLIPTLIYLQENNCFESAELADFINSPLFSRIFGDNFAHAPTDDTPVPESPIEYIVH